MTYRVTIYCPDQHIRYDARTPDQAGVGGGITARLRLAQALGRLGNQVTVVANLTRRERWRGVEYRPLDQTGTIDADVLILSSTGGKLDLSPVAALQVRSDLRLLWVGGVPQVQGIAEAHPDFLVLPSNFIRRVVCDSWGGTAQKCLVVYNGVERETLVPRGFWPRRRDPRRLIYLGHPAKGLEAARAVLRLIRRRDQRFELHVYGGNRLWGESETPAKAEAGVVSHGVLGQRELAGELQRGSFTIALQTIAEAFGIAVAEAMAAGTLAVASPVGAFPEYLRHGENGFFVPGDPIASETQERAANLVIDLLNRPALLTGLRKRASATPLDWMTVARTWQGHWDWALRGRARRPVQLPEWAGACAGCGGAWLPLEDGYHCTGCGDFATRVPGPHQT